MNAIKTPLNVFHHRKLPCGETLKSLPRYLWGVYSAPTVVGREVLTLMSPCLVIAVAAGGLLHCWLSGGLRYGHDTSAGVAGVSGALVFLGLFLCHPLRCVLTMAMPTLLTKQGRRLLLSTSLMILILNVIPNITMNIGVVVHVLKCTSEGFASTLLNSSSVLTEAKADLVREAIYVRRKYLKIAQNIKDLDLSRPIDVSEVKNRFSNISGQIESNFSHARNLLKDGKLLLNRMLAALFVLWLIVESAWYLKSYLTSLQFDNVYLLKESTQKATAAAGSQISLADKKIRSTRHKITKEECSRVCISLVVVTLYFAGMAFIMVLDHTVYQIVEMSAPWLLDIPETSASITVHLKITYFMAALCLIPQLCIEHDLTNFRRHYAWTFSPDPSLCHATPSAPDLGVTVLLGSLWVLSCLFVLLEVLARRLRRKVAGSFFKQQEERRIAFLLMKIQAKHNKREQDVFSVYTARV